MRKRQREMEKAEIENSDFEKPGMAGAEKEGCDLLRNVKVKEEVPDECYKTSVKCEILEENHHMKIKCERTDADPERNIGKIVQIKEEQGALNESQFSYVNCLDYHSMSYTDDTEYKDDSTEEMQNKPLQFVKVEMADDYNTESALDKSEFKTLGEDDFYETKVETPEGIEDIEEVPDTSQPDLLDKNSVNYDAAEIQKDADKNLKSTTSEVHNEKRLYTCDICNRQFNHRCSRSVHRRTHTNVLSFACELCGKAFKMKHYLKRHMRIHTNIHPFTCEVCNKSFSDKYLLTRHFKIHTGERPFVCEICGKGFIRKFNLMQHETTHEEELSFACKICNKRFRFKSTLVQHGRTHTDERPFTCEVCGTRFRFKSDWRRHMKRKHDKEYTSQS